MTITRNNSRREKKALLFVRQCMKANTRNFPEHLQSLSDLIENSLCSANKIKRLNVYQHNVKYFPGGKKSLGIQH